MSDEPQQLKVQVTDRESVTALIYPAAKAHRAGVTLLLGHGAGGNQMAGFMRLFARGLAARGIDTSTFNFLYSEQGRSSPEPAARLESCYRSVIEALLRHTKLKGNRLFIGGKSMGGRIGSQVAAQLAATRTAKTGKANASASTSVSKTDIAGLVFLGYPLHPPGKPEQLRDKHLKEIGAPMLFVQGTRDPFGSPDEFRGVIKRLRLAAKLHLIEGGDHSFKVTKSAGLSQNEVYASAIEAIVAWLQTK